MSDNTQHRHRTSDRTTRRVLIIFGVFLAILIAFIMFRMSASSRVQAQLAAIHAAGYPVTLEELDEWYREPPPGENAADLFLDAFDSYVHLDVKTEMRLPIVGRGELPSHGESLPDDMRDGIAEYLKPNAEALSLLHEAAAMKHCRYPIDLTAGSYTRLPHLAQLRQGARMLHLEAILNAERGNAGQAAQAVSSMLGLTRSLSREPVVISQLVGIACNAIGCSALERVLSRTSLAQEQLVQLGTALADTENLDGMTRAMAGERCSGISIFLGGANLKNMGLKIPSGLGVLHRASGLSHMDLCAYLKIMGRYVERGRLPFPERVQGDDNAVEREVAQLPRYYILTRMLTPALGRAFTEHANCVARLRCAVAALGVERYRLANNALPEKLEDVVPKHLEEIPADPFDGKPLRYKKLDKGYVIYSIGPNGVDDGGIDKDQSKAQTSRRWRRLDIIFRVEKRRK